MTPHKSKLGSTMSIRQSIRHSIIIVLALGITLTLLGLWMPGLQIQSLSSVIGFMIAFIISQVTYWWLFINFFSYLPAWLYPLFSFVLTVGGLIFLGNLVPGILIVDFSTGFWITMILTAVSVILAGYLSLDIDQQFDKQITRKLVSKHGNPEKTDKPGILFLEIDGLSEHVFRKALQKNKMPTLKRWYDEGSHKILGWETDFTSQTGAIQSGILLGNNDNIPAYRWWDRSLKRTIRSGNFWEASSLEKRLSNGEGLLANGGASRGNMFSGDAKESMFTISTVLDQRHGKGPRLYLYLINPFIIVRLVISFIVGILMEWCQSILQKIRKDKFRVGSRNFLYAFSRAADCHLLQGLTTYLVSGDLLRGVPAIYATYAGYDGVGHYTGVESAEAYQTLAEIDQFFARLEYVARHAPRPYQIVVLSDHGQSNGGAFHNTYGITLKQLVKGSINKESKLFVTDSASETSDKIKAFLSDSINSKTRTARVLQTMLYSKSLRAFRENDPGRMAEADARNGRLSDDESLVVIGSGCTGLIYFTNSDQRLPYEVIQNIYPNLIPNLVNHPGIGFVLVHSSEFGDIILGKDGIYYLANDVFEGKNPLGDYSPNATSLLKRECSFSNCPDILVNTSYDPINEILSGFEDQVGHHGGLGGPQSFPFIFHPSNFPVTDMPVMGSIEVHHLLRNWRYHTQEDVGIPITNEVFLSASDKLDINGNS
jgi:putative membrane protein